MQRFFTYLKQQSRTIFGLMTLCSIAFVLRWPAVFFALPYTPHPDEPYVINIVLRMLASGSVFPDSFDRPHLTVYPIWAVLWLIQQVDPLPAALLTIPTDRITQLWTPFVVGRITSIALSILAIPLLYAHLRQRGHTVWAWIGAVWLVVLPFHIAQSGYIAPDGVVAVTTLLVLLGTWRYAAQPSALRWWAVAVAVGLAIGTKYNLAAIILIPAATQWDALRGGDRWAAVRNLGILAIGAVVGFFLTTPGLLVLGQKFLADMQSQVSHYSRHDAGNRPWDLPLYLQFFWTEGWPFVATPLVVWGFGRLVKTREPRDLALVVFLTIELVFFLSRERHYMRNLMPLVVCAPIAYAVAGTWLQQRWRTPWLTPALAAALVAPLLWGAARDYRTMQLPYNRVVVDQVVTALPAGAARVCGLDRFTVANTPSCSAATNKPAEVTLWQQAGMGTFVTTGSPGVPADMRILRTLPDTTNGGNGEGFTIATRDPHTGLMTVGPPAQTSDGLQIVGVRLGTGAARSRLSPLAAVERLPVRANDRTLAINAYLTVTAPVTEPGWWLFVHLVNADGVVVSQRATLPRTDYPIDQWQAGELILIPADIDLPQDLAAGTYTLQIGFYRPSDGARMVITPGSDGAWQLPLTFTR